MKVLQINTYYGKGSTGKIVEQLLTSQEDNKIDGYVMYGKGDMVNRRNVYKINDNLGYYYHKYMTHIFGKHCFYSIYKTKKAVELIDKIGPDIIHLHNLHGHYLNIRILFNYIIKKNIPVVWTFHDCWPFTGHCAYFTEVKCEKWRTGCFNCELKNSYPRSFIFDRSKQSYEDKKNLFTSVKSMSIISVSDWLDSLVSQSFFSKKPHSVIYNWINRNIFSEKKGDLRIRESYNLENKFVILGVAAGWTQRKGIYDFLEMSKYLEEDEIIFLVGKIPSGTDIPDRIINIPAIKDQNLLGEYYKMADVYVNPSRQETFGLTTAEAMSCGTPAVAYDVTACTEVIGTDGQCGYTATPYSVVELYSKIKQVKVKGKTAHSTNAVKRVDQLFNQDTNLNRYINLYNLIADKTKGDGSRYEKD